MKKIFFIASFMVVGLFLEVGVSFAANGWEPTGPTVQDMRPAIKNLAAKGSREDKLISAVKNGDLKNVKTFIAAGADLEARDDENTTALMRAAEKGYSDIFRILMDAGADISAKDDFNCTAFFRAADKNHVDIVKMLVVKGAVDSTFEDMLVRAAHQGNTEMVKALILENPEMKYNTLEKAYMMANSRRNPELFNIIAKALNAGNESQ